MSLGMVAMADTIQEMTPPQRQVATFLSEHVQMLDAHCSLFHFKQKFRPRWESRYLVVGNLFDLPKVTLAILRVHQEAASHKQDIVDQSNRPYPFVPVPRV